MMQSFCGGSGVVGNGVGAGGFDADGLGSPNDSDRSSGSPLMSWRRGGRVNAMFDDQLRGRRGGQQTHADARGATPIADAGGALGDQPVMANSAELAVGHGDNTGVNDGLAALGAMEKAQTSSELGMDDPDAIAFGIAYRQALELGKHGGQITLPAHLRKQVGI